VPSFRFARIAAPFAIAATLAAAALTAAASGAPTVTSGTTTLATIDDAGQPTTFPLYWSTTPNPASLVVVFHGHGHDSADWVNAGELATAAGRDNAIVVAPETTVTSAPNGKGTFDTVDEEARDAAAAIAWARATYHPRSTHLMCVSMGCTGMAYFIDALTRSTAGDADATFVHSQHVGRISGLLVVEGLSNLVETWAEAAAADPVSQAEIEQETGGTPQTAPGGYRKRSLALLWPGSISRLLIKQAAVVHDVNDGLVPANQAAETRAALAAAEVAYHGYTVVRDGATQCTDKDQTTGTSYVGKYVQQYTGDSTVRDNLDPTLCLAGHASETSPTTPVMRTAFNVLHTMTTVGVGPGENVLKVSV
jgi:hypothetical protein